MPKDIRILVVDDDKPIVFALEMYFLYKDYSMYTAQTGEEAIELLAKKEPDLVLLDMKMPGVDGIAVLKHIRTRHPDTKVIIITGFEDEYRKLAEKIGVDEFVVKPIALDSLKTTIEDVLKRERILKEPIPKEFLPDTRTPKAKLLFVESVDMVKGVYCHTFSNPDLCGGQYELDVAKDKDEAISKVNSFEPDLVIIDLDNIRKADELTVEISDLPNRPKDIIITTGCIDRAEVEELKKKNLNVKLQEASIFAGIKGLEKLKSAIRRTALEHDLVA